MKIRLAHEGRPIIGAVPRTLAAVILTLGLASCGSSSDLKAMPDAAAPAPALATASAFCEQYRAQSAALSARCQGGQASDWAAIDDQYVACSRFDEFVAAGTVRYHADLAADCLKTLGPDRGCFGSPNSCFTQALEGVIPAGSPCENDYQCPANAACWAAAEFGYNACGASVCFAVADKPGEPCTALPGGNDFSLCFPGVVTCVQGLCAAYGAAGEPCGTADLSTCDAGLRCDGASATCVPIVSGGACAGDADCLGTEYCGGATCVPRLAIGASCATAMSGCAAFSSCNQTTFVCEPAGHPGQACGSLGGAAYLCVGGSCQTAADGVTTTCRAVTENGGTCSLGSDCASNGCASGVCATCTP